MEREKIYRYFSKTATRETEKEVLAWLEEGRENWDEFLAERRIFDASIMVPERMHSDAVSQPLRSRGRRWLRETLKIAAVAAAVMAGALFYINVNRQELLSQSNVIKVPAGQRIEITLPDGSTVFLNSLSEIEYPPFFHKERRVKLTGEGYFEVAKDVSKPFIVTADKYEVEALGTTFNLNSGGAGEEPFSVSLIEGCVKVSDGSNSVILLADEYVRARGGSLAVDSIEDYDAFRWREGLLCFSDLGFPELLRRMEKYYDVDIVVRRDSLPQVEVSGKIRVSDGVEHALRVLQKNIDFSFHKDGKTIYIR